LVLVSKLIAVLKARLCSTGRLAGRVERQQRLQAHQRIEQQEACQAEQQHGDGID
jgi:hypothetical protein